MDNRPIGVMDSGLGGLTFVKEIRHQLPNESIVFLGDEARLPYGVRSSSEVREFSFQIAKYLLKFDIKMFVIACNTATAAALQFLQEQLDIPVIGVIKPGSQAATRLTKNHQVGVIATQKTIESLAYTNQISLLDSKVKVIGLETQSLVELVESNQMNTDYAQQIISERLNFFSDYQVDTLILGCTHFPLLANEIQSAMGPDVKLIDSGAETASVVKDLLTKNDVLASQHNDNFLKLLTTGSTIQFEKVASHWLQDSKLDVAQVNLGE